MHSDQSELKRLIDNAREQVEVGARYVHYKSPDKSYIVVQIGLLEATQEPCVVYQAEYGENLVWIRTLENFTEEVEFDGRKMQRFVRN